MVRVPVFQTGCCGFESRLLLFHPITKEKFMSRRKLLLRKHLMQKHVTGGSNAAAANAGASASTSKFWADFRRPKMEEFYKAYSEEAAKRGWSTKGSRR